MTEDISDDALLELIHRRYSDPTADWKDFDTQLAVLDIGRLLGVIIGQSKEIRHSKADQMALRAHVPMDGADGPPGLPYGRAWRLEWGLSEGHLQQHPARAKREARALAFRRPNFTQSPSSFLESGR
jgi:hypothetical protein